jgi:hypothetical protein
MGSRTWFKVYSDKWLKGSMREEMPEVRSVFIDLLALAAAGDYGDSGEIKYNDDVGLTDRQIATALNISLKLWRTAKKRFLEIKSIEILENEAIKITNWAKYQSEYGRQKPWRERQKAANRDPDKYVKGRYGQLVKR